MIIHCTQCGALITINKAQRDEKHVKCPQCGCWEEYSEDVKTGEFVSLAGKGGQAFCLGCRKTAPKTNLFYNRSMDSYYHEKCVPVGSELLTECPKCGQYTATDSTYCSKCGSQVKKFDMVEYMVCDECEAKYDTSHQYCKNDGKKLVSQRIERIDPTHLNQEQGVPTKIPDTSVSDDVSTSRKNDSHGFVTRLARGDLGLAKTFWLYGFIPAIIVNVMVEFIDNRELLIMIFLGYMAYEVPVLMGTWRAANKYKGFSLWGIEVDPKNWTVA